MATTLVKRHEHRAAFDAVFDVWFSVRCPSSAVTTPSPPGSWPTCSTPPCESGDEQLLAELARQAVARLAGMEAGRAVRRQHYVFRTLRQLDVDGALDRLLGGGSPSLDESLRARRAGRPAGPAEGGDRGRGPPPAGGRAGAGGGGAGRPPPLPAEVDFLHATPEDLAALRRRLAPLARRMAARLARKRRHRRHGRLDFRSTCATPCPTAVRRPSPGSAVRTRRSRRSSCWPTSPARWPPSPASRCSSSTPSGRRVLQGALVRVHRRDRRGHVDLRGRRRLRRRPGQGQRRGRRGVGRRPLRLRARLPGFLGPVGDRDHAEDVGGDPGRRPQQLPPGQRRSPGRPAPAGPPRVLAEPRAAVLLGHRRLHRLAGTARTATGCSSAATCASSSASWPRSADSLT